MIVFYDEKKVTDSTKTKYRKVWCSTEKIQITADKIWISNMKNMFNLTQGRRNRISIDRMIIS